MALNSLIACAMTFRQGKSVCKLKLFQPNRNQCFRLLSCSSPSDNKKKTFPEEINRFVLNKYTNYIKNYESILAKRFPKTMTLYRGFLDGVSFFYKDVKLYLKILSKMNGSNFHNLTRQEIEIYHQVPKDMIKLAPVLIGSLLPFGYAVMMPLAYWFPRVFMTESFWTAAQRQEFTKEKMAMRLKHAAPVLKLLAIEQTACRKNYCDENHWVLIMTALKTEQTIVPHQLIGCIEMFRNPFNIDRLSQNHLRHLAKLHNVRALIFPRKKLKQHAQIVMAMDRAIIREGGIKTLSLEDMRKVCMLRGLYAAEMDREEMMLWLNKWMYVSVSIDESSFSLLLHTSAILGSNIAANQKLLSESRRGLNKLGLKAFKRIANTSKS